MAFATGEESEERGEHFTQGMLKQQTIMQNSESPTLDVSRFVKMANRNIEFLEKTLKSTASSFEQYHEEFNSIAIEATAERVGALLHKMTMSLYYVQADELQKLITDFRGLLEEETQSEQARQEMVRAVQAAFEELTKELKTLNAKELLGD